MNRGDAGRLPLVLLPGTLCDSYLWQNQVENLADRTIPRVHDISRDDSIGAIARRVLAETPVRFLLAGLSMGGVVAFEIMRVAPERVLGLALLDTNPAMPDRGLVEQWNREIVMAQRGGFEEFVEDRWIPSLIAAGGSRAPTLRDIIRRMAHAIGPAQFIRQTLAQIARPDSRPSLSNIACPTLVLGGHDDSMCPPVLHEAMASVIPHAQLALVEDCGHLSTLEQPEAVTALLREWVDAAQRHDTPVSSSAARGEHRA